MILGIIVGIYFGRKNMIEYHGPNSNDVKKWVYKDRDGNYYKFMPEICICPI